MAVIRYIIDLPSGVSDEISQLIESGRYRSIQDFLLAAASNQLHLEQHGPAQGLVITQASHSPEVTTIYHALLTRDFPSVQPVPPPDPNYVSDELHGLWNKLFPVKITTRVLANLLKGGEKYVSLEATQERASDIARQLGKAAVRKEKDLGRERGDMIATALPWKREEFKARTRFKTHFVGYISTNSIEGAPATLRFVNVTKANGAPMIGVTATGLKFANLINPVIDQEDYSASFSTDERQFLMDHIRTELPKEANLMNHILVSVQNGARSPSSLQAKLHNIRPELNNNELATLRAGLLSRMYELNLMRRKRNGLNVTYQVTPEGESFLKGDRNRLQR